MGCRKWDSTQFLRLVNSFTELPLSSLRSTHPFEMERTAEGRRSTVFPCDACRRRKVRCNYARPCDRCQSYNLVCTFDSVRKKRGPKKGQGAVVEQLRAESRKASASQSLPPDEVATNQFDTAQGSSPQQDSRSQAGSTFTNYAGPTSMAAPTPVSDGHTQPSVINPELVEDDYLTFDEFAQNILGSSSQDEFGVYRNEAYSTSSPAQLQNLLSNVDSITIPSTPLTTSFEVTSITEHGINLFFSHIYPIYPILDEKAIRSSLVTPSEIDPANTCMLFAMCAMSLVHVESWPNMSSEQRAVHSRKYIRQCQQIRMQVDFIEEASFADMVCSLFIAVTYFELKSRKASWFYVREAITLAHALGLHLLAPDLPSGDVKRLREQRAYAILFITERGACVLDNFPVTILSPPSLLRDALPGEDPAVSLGLSSLHHLFSLLDFDFVRLWNDLASMSSIDQGFPQLSRLQQHLRQDLGIHGISDIQRADVLITQQWLRLVFWQAALRLGLISSSSADPAFTYHYPIEIASSLCAIVKSLPPVAIQVHGLGIVSIWYLPHMYGDHV